MGRVIEEVEADKEDKKKVDLEAAYIRFGLELKRIRESKNINQRELHDITKIDKTVISELERGLYPPSLPIIKDLSDGLGVSPHILVAAYYDIPLPEFNLKDKETLDQILKIASNYLKDSPPHQTSQRPDPDAQDLAGKEVGMKIHRARSAARKRASQKENQPKDTDK